MLASRTLVHARRHAGMTQRDLARATGIPQPAIARIERGVVIPRVDTLDRLLEGAGASLESGAKLGVGVDRTLIRASLQLSAEDRIRAAGAAARHLASFLTAVRRGSRR